jgi:hypothetical protein
MERGASRDAFPRGAWERSEWGGRHNCARRGFWYHGGKSQPGPKLVPTLCVGMQPLTLRVIAVFSLLPRVKLERGASLEAFPRGAWERSGWADVEIKIVPTLCVGMQPLTLRVIAVLTLSIMVRLERGASLEALPRGAWERSGWGRCGDKDRSHALRGNAATDAPRHSGFQPVAKGEAGTRSVPGGVTTRSVGTIRVGQMWR